MDFRDTTLPIVKQWTAKWITLPLPDDSGQRYRAYRGTFSTDAVPDDAVVHVSAENEYALYLNGRLAGYGPAAAPPAFKRYDSFRAGEFLRPGRNAVAALVRSRNARDGGYNLSGPANGAFLFQLDSGGRTVAATDESWRAAVHCGFRSDAVSMGAAYLAESFQAGLFPEDWNETEFDASGWEHAVPAVSPVHRLWGGEQSGARFFPWVHLQPSEVKRPLRRRIRPAAVECREVRQAVEFSPNDAAIRIGLESLLEPRHVSITGAEESLRGGTGPVTVRNSDPLAPAEEFDGIFNAVLILDFGRPVNGRLKFTFNAAESYAVDIGYATARNPDGRLVTYAADYIRQADAYLGAPGRHSHESFDWRHFRYLQLSFRSLNAPLTIEELEVTELYADFEEQGAFSASDPLLGRIWKGAVQTLRLCCTDQAMDNPQRERRQYLGDCAAQIPALLAAFGDNALSAKYFRQFDQTRHATGLYRYSTWHRDDGASLFDHSLLFPIRLLDYWRFTGNTALVRELLPGLARLTALIGPLIGPDGLAHDPPYSLWFDWADVGRRDCSFLLNACLLRALECCALLGEAAGTPAAASPEFRTAAEIRLRLRRRFFVPESGLFADTRLPDGRREHFSEHANLLALAFGIADAEQAAAIRRALETGTPALAVSSPCWQFAAEGFLAGEMTDLLIAWLHRRFDPLFRRGVTTVPETWTPGCENTLGRWRFRNGRTEVQGSGVVIHPWVFLEKLCGITPLRPGFAAVRFLPRPGGLTELSGTMPAPDGPHRLELVRTGEGWRLHLELPRRKPAEFVQTMPGRCAINGEPREPDFRLVRADGTECGGFRLPDGAGFDITVTATEQAAPAPVPAAALQLTQP